MSSDAAVKMKRIEIIDQKVPGQKDMFAPVLSGVPGQMTHVAPVGSVPMFLKRCYQDS